jgi:hypothetical protein
MPDIAASLTDAVLTKQCCTCREILPIAKFAKASARKDGLQGACQGCMNQAVRKHSQKDPIRTQVRQMLRDAARRASGKSLNFDIDFDCIRPLVVSHCPVLGTPLQWSCCRGDSPVSLAGSPSLDRIDPTKGYVKGNVWIISHRANRIKSDATHEELKLVAKAVGEALVESLEF